MEGAETRTLRGARRTLEQFRPLVLVEVNSAALARAGTTASELLGEISALGGYTFQVVEEPGVLRRIDPATLPTSPRGYWNVLCVPQRSAAEHRLAARVDFI